MEKEINLSVFSPVSGLVKPLSEIPDAVFAEKMLGDGLAVNPTEDFAYSPIDGTIKTLHKSFHALVIENKGVEILIHIGVETVNMRGEGFKAFVQQGQAVKKGDKLIGFDRALMSKKVPSNLVIVIVANKPQAPLQKTFASEVKHGDFLFSLGNKSATQQGPCAGGNEIFSENICVLNKNGFHARPAARIAKVASAFEDADIYILKKDLKANAKSVVEILSLAIDFKDEIIVSACGAQKEEALKEVTRAIIAGLNENITPFALKPRVKPDFSAPVELHGLTVFPGLVIGKAFIMKKPDIKVEEFSSNPAAELEKLSAAIEKVRRELENVIAGRGPGDKKEILEAHLTLLADPFLINTAQACIRANKTACYGWRSAVRKGIAALNSAGSKYLQERIEDYRDAETRVLVELTGSKFTAPDFPKDSIVIARDLLSYELALFNNNVVGVIMALGSSTSHVAIMLRNMGLASVIGVGDDALDIPPGSDIILNSELGLVTVNPRNIEEIKKQRAQREALRAHNLAHTLAPCHTIDGVAVAVSGNVGSLEEAQKAAELGAQGIGILRTEFLFSRAATAPSEHEQFELYSKIAAAQKGKGTIIRTLDAGGDKPLAYLPLPPEENPIIGLRGVRTYKMNLDLFKRQVRAIMRANASIMLPMVTFVDELLDYKNIIQNEAEALGIKNISLGIMVEVPSAALLAGEFARHIDFFSLGTNDLTQYALAIDRGHPALSPKADPLNPAVLKLIDMTVKGAARFGKKVGVCGAVASDIIAVPVLLGLGLRDLSVVSSLIPDIKAFIRTLDMRDCQTLAALALNMQEGRQVRDMVKGKYKI